MKLTWKVFRLAKKHEIVIMYGLLFGVRKGSIVLIDEPEISLHVAWQLHFYTGREKNS